ncbi:DUF6778 family protein [Pseudogemmobacter humi]|uniref:Lipoprotein n=1 Tax=Pseudogemmobacter humi TaxID=2483812 RepID=A0A3P5XA76_9RHOB|nr:DUF6778 family protein [Pseudogemmobacter humi]VDC31518.1 hypothetical protein XINFAN_02919 [Pseudogemmobacter humi]
MLRKTFITLGLTLFLAGCFGSGTFQTNYQQIDRSIARDWRVAKISVEVPRSLSVSEKNSYMPRADIVWHGDPMGDRYAQIEAIFRDALQKGTRDLRGSRPVTIQAVVTRFHALTPRARGMDGNVGVHDIRFDITVFDARTGAALTATQAVEADFAALVGQAAADADARGYTQKEEIGEHLVKVFRNWLGGYGEDPRNSFSRMGR